MEYSFYKSHAKNGSHKMTAGFVVYCTYYVSKNVVYSKRNGSNKLTATLYDYAKVDKRYVLKTKCRAQSAE